MDYYDNIPEEEVQQLKQWEDTHPKKKIAHGGLMWPYLDVGEGEPVMLSLTGVLGLPEFGWYTLDIYGQHMRVIAPQYNTAPTLKSLCEGIAAILDHEGITTVDVKGGSYGGYIAQEFLRRYPERVRRVILSHTSPPTEDALGALRRSLFALRLAPEGLVRRAFKRRFAGTLPDEERLINAHYEELVDTRLDKSVVVSTLQRAVQFHQRDYSPGDLNGWDGEILIVNADNDDEAPPAEQERLRALYPQAREHTFHGTGHSTAVLKTEEYTQLVLGFLQT